MGKRERGRVRLAESSEGWEISKPVRTREVASLALHRRHTEALRKEGLIQETVVCQRHMLSEARY